LNVFDGFNHVVFYAKNYFSDSKYRVIQAIIQYNKSKEPKYGTPEDCITGILENSEQLQSIIEKEIVI
jgi:hypothetical protein